jgi:hypothetical protein
MFNRVNRDFKDLRYGDARRRRKIFWILTIGLFIAVVAVWLVFFGGSALEAGSDRFSSSTFEGFRSLWQNAKEQFGSITPQVKDLSGQLLTSTSTQNSTSTEN